MIGLKIILDGDGAYKDIEDLEDGQLTRVALLQHGTASGRPTVSFLVQSADGKHVMGQTTLRLLESAVLAMVARAGMNDPDWREGSDPGPTRLV